MPALMATMLPAAFPSGRPQVPGHSRADASALGIALLISDLLCNLLECRCPQLGLPFRLTGCCRVRGLMLHFYGLLGYAT
jgi:hypothetical protein